MLLKFKARLVFYRNFLRFRTFILNQKDFSLENLSTQKYTIIIDPWMLNITPWFAITTGILLRKKGHQIKFLINNLRFEGRIDHKIQIHIFKLILNKLVKNDPHYQIDELKNTTLQTNTIADKDVNQLRHLAKANAIHKFRGEIDSVLFNDVIDANFKLYVKNFQVIKNCILTDQDSTFLVSGGIYAYSGLMVYLLRNANIHYFTYDSGFNILLSCYNGVASHLADLPVALELLKNDTSNDDIKFALNKSHDELNARINGTNLFNTQYQKVEDSVSLNEVGFLIPLNSPWDSAALMIDHLFDGYNNWLLETVDMILKNTNEVVTIRQHPDERHEHSKSSVDFGKILKQLYPRNNRIQFLSCYDKVNTYALLDKAKAVICFSSTFGVESAINNKKTIVCSNVYYSKLSFVYKPKSKSDLINILKNIDLLPTPDTTAKTEADLIFYLGQKCNWLITPFTPMITDYTGWLQIGLDNLLETESVKCYLESLEKHIPLAFVNHRYQKLKECSDQQLINSGT